MDPLPPAPSRWAGRGWGAASFLLPPPGGARSGSQARDPSVRPDSSDGAGVGCCGPHLPTEDARALTGWASVQRKAAPRFPQPLEPVARAQPTVLGSGAARGSGSGSTDSEGPTPEAPAEWGVWRGHGSLVTPCCAPHLASHAAQDPQAPASGGSCLCPPGLAGLPCAARTGRADLALSRGQATWSHRSRRAAWGRGSSRLSLTGFH